MENPVLELAQELISRISVTPEDAGCQELISNRLAALGFQTRQINAEGVHNLWAWRGTGSPHLMFAGHTDVVPPGPISNGKHLHLSQRSKMANYTVAAQRI